MPLFRVRFTVLETGEAKILDISSKTPEAARKTVQARHEGKRLAYGTTKVVREAGRVAHS